MFKKRYLFFMLFIVANIFAVQSSIIGVVNFSNCMQDSKYGKHEQDQLEKIKKQWSTMIEDSSKELDELAKKMEDQDYMDGLSPEAEKEMTEKKQVLNEDIMKYQNQLYQVMNQAQYFFVQKMVSHISKASEEIAKGKNLDLVLNQEACFYSKPNIEVTTVVIEQMDKNFDEEQKKLSENQEKQAKEDAKKIAEKGMEKTSEKK